MSAPSTIQPTWCCGAQVLAMEGVRTPITPAEAPQRHPCRASAALPACPTWSPARAHRPRFSLVPTDFRPCPPGQTTRTRTRTHELAFGRFLTLKSVSDPCPQIENEVPPIENCEFVRLSEFVRQIKEHESNCAREPAEMGIEARPRRRSTGPPEYEDQTVTGSPEARVCHRRRPARAPALAP